MKRSSLINQILGSTFLPDQYFQDKTSNLSKFVVQPIKRHLSINYANLLKKGGTQFIGITGTAGKTSTKDMLFSVLSEKFSTNYSKANIDPIYNIPSTILNTHPFVEKVILEMGVEYPGDMNFYIWLCPPQVGIVTSIYWAHTEHFGDINGVFSEKSKLIKALPKTGYAILNADDPNVAKMAKLTKARVLWFSQSKKTADIYASNIRFTDDFKTTFVMHYKGKKQNVSLPVLGKHFVGLACATALVGVINKMTLAEISAGLSKFKSPAHRMSPHNLGRRGMLIDDTYNANPLATTAAVSVVADISKNRTKILVLGEMKELGAYAKEGHKQVGRAAARAKFDYIIGLGELPNYTVEEAIKAGLKKSNCFVSSSKAEIVRFLKSNMNKNTITLIKGSRSMKMEEIVRKII